MSRIMPRPSRGTHRRYLDAALGITGTTAGFLSDGVAASRASTEMFKVLVPVETVFCSIVVRAFASSDFEGEENRLQPSQTMTHRLSGTAKFKLPGRQLRLAEVHQKLGSQRPNEPRKA